MGTMGDGLPGGSWPVPRCPNDQARAPQCRARCQTHVHRVQRALANLPTAIDVGRIANMRAELITHFNSVAEDGGVMELVVWRVPRPVPPAGHGYKYRAVYAVDGVRVVGFDNERGKGDHCHLHGRE